MNKKLFLSITAITFAVFSILNASAMSFLPYSSYSSYGDDYNSFRPSYNSGNYYNSNYGGGYDSYYPSRGSYAYPDRISSRNYGNNPYYDNSYSSYQPYYGNSYRKPYGPFYDNYLSVSQRNNLRESNKVNQNTRIRLQDINSISVGPCVSYTEFANFDGKEHDYRIVQEYCHNEEVNQLSNNLYEDKIDSKYSFDNSDSSSTRFVF
jgi:hypothetical protein